jgi:hypothetical protein
LRILAVVWFSLWLIGGPTLVVCHAGSGHVGLEMAHEGACNKSTDASGADAAAVVETFELDCQDQAVLDTAIRVERQNTELAVPALLPLIHASAFPAAPGLANARPEPSDIALVPPWHLTPLASVVLLI